MTEGNFVDYVKIYVASGKGGKGSTHLHREKFIEKGGPDGGDGGRGGHVYIVGNEGLWTLYHLKFARHIKAGHGGDGGSARSTGADGEDKIIEVPLGTVVKDKETGEVLFEITENGEKKYWLKAVKADWVTGISEVQPIRLHAILNPEYPERSLILSLN